MIECGVCSEALGLRVVHTGAPCEPGKSAFASTSEEYANALKFFQEIETMMHPEKEGTAPREPVVHCWNLPPPDALTMVQNQYGSLYVIGEKGRRDPTVIEVLRWRSYKERIAICT